MIKNHWLRSLEMAKDLRERGYNPLPSSLHLKRPNLESYAQYWTQRLPDEQYTAVQWSTTNIQVMSGAFWKLGVIDCDGPHALTLFRKRCQKEGYFPRTWVSISGSRNSWHFWYTVPKVEGKSSSHLVLPSKVIWRGSGKHQLLELLCESKLVMTPPSIHPVTREEYLWAKGCSPKDIERPAPLPTWIYGASDVDRPVRPPQKIRIPWVPCAPDLRRLETTEELYYNRNEVLAAIQDKVGLAESWGLKLARHGANHSGFIPCHAVSQQGHDRHPSATIKESTGQYWEHPGINGISTTISLFDLGAILLPAQFPTWRDCLAWCAKIHGITGVRARSPEPSSRA